MINKRNILLPVLMAVVIVSGCTKEVKIQNPIAVWVIGEVTLQRASGSIATLEVGDRLQAGDEVMTSGYSHAAIQIGDTVMVKVDRNTTLSVSKLMAGKEHELFLKQGKVFSKVKRLTPGSEFRVKTPSIVAAVRGTSFSVSSGKAEQKVAVVEGLVQVKGKKADTGEEISKDAPAGKTVVVTDKVEERPIEEAEKLEIKRVAIVPFIEKPESLKGKEYDKLINKLSEQDDEIGKKIEKQVEEKKKKEVPKTLTEVKQKYGRVDEITLYNGKVYRGVILGRGSTYSILTTGGKVYVPKKNVRSTRVIR